MDTLIARVIDRRIVYSDKFALVNFMLVLSSTRTLGSETAADCVLSMSSFPYLDSREPSPSPIQALEASAINIHLRSVQPEFLVRGWFPRQIRKERPWNVDLLVDQCRQTYLPAPTRNGHCAAHPR